MKTLGNRTPDRMNLKRKGFVLIELLVTVVILSTGILYIVDSFSASLRASKRVLATKQAIDVGLEIKDQILSDKTHFRYPASGETIVGNVVYKWGLVNREPIALTSVSGSTWVVTLRIEWNEPISNHIELPVIWSSS